MFLFFTTLGIGGIAGVLIGLLLDLPHLGGNDTSFLGVLLSALWLFGVGMTFSAISQMAFFSYLLVHRLGLGMFKSERLWNQVQIVLILFVFFDLVYFRYSSFADPGQSWVSYLFLPLVLLLASVPFAYIKAKETKAQAFVPALFLFFVVTTIASLPALRANDPNWILLMMIPIFSCFVWQLLMLHRLNTETKKKNA